MKRKAPETRVNVLSSRDGIGPNKLEIAIHSLEREYNIIISNKIREKLEIILRPKLWYNWSRLSTI